MGFIYPSVPVIITRRILGVEAPKLRDIMKERQCKTFAQKATQNWCGTVCSLHWSTANVNLVVDATQVLSHSLVFLRMQKAIVPADIAPVQHPGHTWKPRVEYPDHSWDQSQVNAVIPMTFLFMQTKVSQSPASRVEC